ncbi:hypothetical protein D3C81_2040560 [compost metagenome]
MVLHIEGETEIFKQLAHVWTLIPVAFARAGVNRGIPKIRAEIGIPASEELHLETSVHWVRFPPEIDDRLVTPLSPFDLGQHA